MFDEAPQELRRAECHLPLPVAIRIIFPTESNALAVEGQQALVADGDAMRIAAEIPQHLRRSAECRLGADDPVFAEQDAQEGREFLRFFKSVKSAAETELVVLMLAVSRRRTCLERPG